ncbi:S-adenosyl-L-methionine-dependent methyltransferase [Macrolepiota fuliginosa MF-IS2]|uniref:S-adenosyl-L-methionine-dependent methyltransferase n=1 Tax=Macrolepiota fuliginosa MF-IS2 TaxID=1400762 RepID=A0A9P6CAI6_9AGAR|nr:S-adenosyl-L-methionine-dependent methyltransferase [Macrolepiota fuliginosa MF-IS2]
MPEIEHSEKRNYTTAFGTVYSLPHDEEERKRLTGQSNLLLRVFDNKVLHAPAELSDEDWVLETGSGTGIWLQDLANSVMPSKPKLIGTDIESRLFPDPSTLPQNIEYRVQSVLSLPLEWTDRFTVVHQRLLVAGLRAHEWPRAFDELYRVTRPGGWVQICEVDTWMSGPALGRFTDLLFALSDDRGTLWRDISQRIPTLLNQSSFVNVHRLSRATVCGDWAGQHGIDGKENMLAVVRSLKIPILQGGGYGMVTSEAEYDELVEQINREYDTIPGSQIVWTMFVAQKPFVTKL